MGKIWMSGGGGGADLDVTTAGSGDVLAGKVIVDKDGEPLNGTMPNIGSDDECKWMGHDGSRLYFGMSNGAHVTNSDIGYPRVRAPLSAVASAVGVTADKILAGQSACGVDGNVPVYGGTYWNSNLEIGAEANNLYSFFPVGYYGAFDGRGSLHRIPIDRLRYALGVSADKIKEGQSIAGVAGTMRDYSYLAIGQTSF